MAEGPEFRTTMHFAYGEPRELAPGVVRIVANNPSPFTFKGTNTYLVGSARSRADRSRPGRSGAPEGHPRMHRAAPAQPRRSSPTRTATTPTACRRCSRPPAPRRPASAAAPRNRGTKRTSPSGSEFVDQDFVARCCRLPTASGSRATAGRSRRVHTPGHAPDHLCFALEGTRILFSGDHVMGWNTSVVAPPEGNMGDYMRSLELLNGARRPGVLPRPRRPGRGAAAPGEGLPAAPAHARAGDPGVHPRRQQHVHDHRAGHLPRPEPQAPQRSVSFCARAR